MEYMNCRFCGNELEVNTEVDDYSMEERIYITCKNCDVTTIIKAEEYTNELPNNYWTSCVAELEFNLEEGWSTDPIPQKWKEKCDACHNCADCWQHEYRKEILTKYAIEYYNSKRSK